MGTEPGGKGGSRGTGNTMVNFIRIQEGIHSTTVCDTNIKHEDELSRGAFIGFAWEHDGACRSATFE